MRVGLAILLNAVLLLGLARWLRRQSQQPETGPLVLPLLALQLAAGAVSVGVLSEDARLFLYWGHWMTEQFWTSPRAWVHTLLGDTFHYAGRHLIYHGFSNTFFLMKLVSVLNLASLGNALLNGLYMSAFKFVGGWQLVRALRRTFPATPLGAGIVALFLWPTVLYWTAGVTKESILVGCLAWLTALVIGWLYGGQRVRVGPAVGGAVLLVVGFKMRFFFAVLLFAGLLGLAAIRLVQHLGGGRQRWGQVGLFGLVLAGGAAVLSEVSTLFRFNRFSSQLIYNYHELLRMSAGRPHIEFAHLAPTLESILANAPKAAISALLRPMPWETARLPYVAAGVENLLLLGLLGGALVAAWRGRSGHLPFALVLALLSYCLALAVLLGLSTPNLGTLSRYRTALLPFLLLLLLQNDYVRRLLKRGRRGG